MHPILIIKAGEKLSSLAGFPGDFEDWIIAGLGVNPAEVQVVAVHRGAPLPDPANLKAILITGSGAMVTDASPWIESTAAWLREAVNKKRPTLGICFGHQLLAYALGGVVADNPNGVEVGTVLVKQAEHDDVLLGGLPQQFSAQLSHRQSVIALPRDARLLASSEREPHQAFAWGECAWGVQFHPEFSAEVVKAYVEFYRPDLRDADVLLRNASDTPQSAQLLQRFAALVFERG